jgi:hypothetical protein
MIVHGRTKLLGKTAVQGLWLAMSGASRLIRPPLNRGRDDSRLLRSPVQQEFGALAAGELRRQLYLGNTA